ncbi:hypothetical protein EJB05_26324, partial [Eragrostis curvula]
LDFRNSIDHFMRRKDDVVSFGGEDQKHEVSDLPGLTDKWFSCVQCHLKRVSLQFHLETSNGFGVQLANFFFEKAMFLEELYIDDGNHKMCKHMNRKFGGRITNPLQPSPDYKVTSMDKKLVALRLALRCCHNLKTVAADLSELCAFEYRGGAPPPSFRWCKHSPFQVLSCMLDFCGCETTDPRTLVKLRDFFHLFASATDLKLKSARLGAGVSHGVFSRTPALPIFATLRELELTGILNNDDTAAVATVTRILERIPSLEILSLFFLPEPREERDQYRHCSNEDIFNEHWLKYDRYAPLVVPVGMEIPCLRKRTKEINFVHYQGALAQRRLARFLLCNAPVVGEVCCEFAKGPLTMQTQLMEEIRGWVLNKSANMMFF